MKSHIGDHRGHLPEGSSSLNHDAETEERPGLVHSRRNHAGALMATCERPCLNLISSKKYHQRRQCELKTVNFCDAVEENETEAHSWSAKINLQDSTASQQHLSVKTLPQHRVSKIH
jgi:hypothetical protein